MNFLPDEIISEIFYYVLSTDSIDEFIKTVRYLSQVCKRWRQTLLSEKIQWTNIESLFMKRYRKKDPLRIKSLSAKVSHVNDQKYHVRISDTNKFFYFHTQSYTRPGVIIGSAQLAVSKNEPVVVIHTGTSYHHDVMAKSWSKKLLCHSYYVVKHGLFLVDKSMDMYSYRYFDLNDQEISELTCFDGLCDEKDDEIIRIREILTDPSSGLVFIWMRFLITPDKVLCLNPKRNKIIWSGYTGDKSSLVSAIRKRLLEF